MQYNFEFIMAVLKLDEKKLNELKKFIRELNEISYERKYKSDLCFCGDIINHINSKKKIRNKINRKTFEKYYDLLCVLTLDEKTFNDIIYRVTFPNVRGFNNFYKLIDMLLNIDRSVIYKNISYLLSLGIETMNFVTNNDVTYNIGIDTIINDGTIKGIISDGKCEYFSKTGNIILENELTYNIYKNYNVRIKDFKFIVKYIKNDKTGLLEFNLDISSLDFDYNLLKLEEHLNVEHNNQKIFKI